MNHRLLTLTLTACFLPAAIAQTGVNTTNMDRTVKPGDDFYLYANGGYVKSATIPADRTGVGAFTIIGDRIDKRLNGIITDPALTSAPAGSDARKIADLYKSYMDEAAIESHGRASLDAQLKPILAIHDQKSLAEVLGHALRDDVDALNNTNFYTPNLFGLWVAPSFNDPDHYAPYLLQGGLGLPGREYYLADSPRMKTIRDAYVKHLQTNFELVGISNAADRAARVMALEHAIAEKHISLEDSESIAHANNPWSMAEFATKAPGLDWKTYFAAADLGTQKIFIVWQPSAFTAESALVASTPIDTWKDYLAAHLINTNAASTSKALADEAFAFRKLITGAQQQRPRQQRGVALVSNVLGDAVGKIYADKYFTAADKAKVQVLVGNIIDAFRARLQTLTWMAPATRAEAITKLNALQVGIGYTDHFRTYGALEIKPDDLFGNMQRDSMFEYKYSLSRIGKPTDRKEWVMTPQTVNAVNLPLDNGLNFPAAILEPPFYDPAASDAVNYGSMGGVIGHEISHTFDSEGAAFDSEGRVRDWWTPADLAHFNASTAALAAQYDTYKPFPDASVNGKQTLGENIADAAGLQAAYDAYRASLHGKEAPSADGMTGDQQFFIAFGQSWAESRREAALRAQLLGDPHAPGKYRALTVRNVDGWYKAFDVKPGDALYLAPADRVHIW
jgi:putative endopeptidase